MVFLQVLGIAVLAPWVALELRERWRPEHRLDVAASLALFALAFALRWWLPAHAFLHENHHSYEFDADGPLTAYLTEHGVVSSHLALAWLWRLVTPLADEPIFQMNALASSVAVVGMYWLGRLLFGSRLVGWSAACLLALLPVAILAAPTEEFLVSATGLCLAGLPLCYAGARPETGGWATLHAGALLVALGSSAREIAQPLAALGPLAMLAAMERRPSPSTETDAAARARRRSAWSRIGSATALMVATLAPRAIAILTVARGAPVPRFMGAPRFPFAWHPGRGFDAEDWIGWSAPYVPRWLGLLAMVSMALLVGDALRRRRLGPALVAVGGFALAQAASGMVVSGWFPTHLRHQQAAIALAMLGPGWLIGAAGTALSRGSRWANAAAWALAPAAGALTLGAAPAGYRLQAPIVDEYRFFHDTLRGLPPRATALYFPPVEDESGAAIPHLARGWLASLRPSWHLLPVDALPRVPGEAPTYLLLDRTCFLNHACITKPTTCERPEVVAAARAFASPYGRMSDECHRALESAPWKEVARKSIVRLDGREYDLPSLDPIVDIAVLQLPGSQSASHQP
jgi:hypothetical protein